MRVAIIHQLGWKADAEPARIFGYCAARPTIPTSSCARRSAGHCGTWRGRSPTEVRDFVEAHRDELSPLSVREATKHL